MINTIELEKRWLRYKTKIFSSLFFIIFFVLAIPYLSYYLFNQYNLIVNEEDISKVEQQYEQLSTKDELSPKVEKNLTVSENINDVVLAPSIPIIDFKNEKEIDRKVEKKKLDKEKLEQQKVENIRLEKERAYRKKMAKRRAVERKRARARARQKALAKKSLDKKNLVKAKAYSSLTSSELKVVNGEDNKREETETKKINFNRSGSNYMAIMKRKFEQNKNPREAILIAKAYYKAGNYVESEKWALSANNLDKNSEESWFLFAKSKAKLGKRKEALKILVSYNKKNKSIKAKELIYKIKSGSI